MIKNPSRSLRYLRKNEEKYTYLINHDLNNNPDILFGAAIVLFVLVEVVFLVLGGDDHGVEKNEWSFPPPCS